MTTSAQLTAARPEPPGLSVRDEYISAVNNALAADREDLAVELAADYEQQYLRPSPGTSPPSTRDR